MHLIIKNYQSQIGRWRFAVIQTETHFLSLQPSQPFHGALLFLLLTFSLLLKFVSFEVSNE